MADGPRLPEQARAAGRFLTFDADQRFEADGQQVVSNVRLLGGLLRFAFCGTYDLRGRRMQLTFETLRVRLLGFIRFSLDMREGRGVRSVIERRLRGMPNEYRWCFADDGLCVAQGTSGSVAAWVAA